MATQRTKIYLEGVALDLDKNVDIDFTYSIADISDFDKRTTTFSKTVTIPGTAHNNFLLGNYFNFNINNDYSDLLNNVGVNYNPLKKAFVKVTLDNVEIFAGVLRLLEITSKDNELQYQCALFGSLGGLFSAVGDKLLTDLDLTALTHTYDIGTITDSWATTDLADQGYVYPLANYGINIGLSEASYDVKNFRPAVSVKRLFNEIIDQAGYTYNSDIWDSNNLDKLILQNGEEKFTAFYDELNSVTLNTISTPGQITFLSNTTNGLSVDLVNNSFKNLTGDTLNLKLHYSIQGVSDMDLFISAWVATNIYDSSNNLKTSSVTTVAYGSGTTESVNTTYTLDIVLENNEYVKFYFGYTDILGGLSGSGFTLANTSTITSKPSASTSKIPAIYLSEIQGKSIVPEGIKQSDFLKNIINLLNLYIVQDPDNEFKLNFIPYPDFYSGDTVDWSDKIDFSKGFSIKPSSEFTPKSYSFKYKDDTDYYSKIYKNKYGINYGDLKYISGNEFSKDDKATEFIFSLAPVVNTGKTDRLMAQLYDINTDGTYKQVKANPKLSFWGGSKTTANTYTVTYKGATISTLTNYGYAGHIYNPFTTSDGRLWDLAFNSPYEVYFNISSYPTQNLYNIYYTQLIGSQNNKDAKIVTLYLLLNSIDITNLNFRDYYKIDNGLYYLNKIDGYNPLSNDLTKVELLRIVEIEELDVYIEYAPAPYTANTRLIQISTSRILDITKVFTCNYQYTDGSNFYTGTVDITVPAGYDLGTGAFIPLGNTYTYIQVLPPANDPGYIYVYGGDYTTF